jgi:hypothetical protein
VEIDGPPLRSPYSLTGQSDPPGRDQLPARVKCYQVQKPGAIGCQGETKSPNLLPPPPLTPPPKPDTDTAVAVPLMLMPTRAKPPKPRPS